MMKKKWYDTFLLGVSLLILILSCVFIPVNAEEGSGIEHIWFTEQSITLKIGDEAYLNEYLQISPADAAGQNLEWNSLNSSVATVTTEGKVTAVCEGGTTISAKAENNVTGYIGIQVELQQYDFSGIEWNYNTPFIYNGEVKTVEVTGLPDGVTALYSGNTASDAGNYVASVTLTSAETNHVPTFVTSSLSSSESNNLPLGTIDDLHWTINKASYDLSTLEWNYTAPFVYIGVEKTVEVSGLPDGVTASYLGNSASDTGDYVASVTLSSDDPNYLQPGDIESLHWSINEASYDLSTVEWNYTVPFVYTGAEKTVEVSGLPDGVTASFLGNSASDAGDYVASVMLSSTDPNYLQPGDIEDLHWSINKASYDLSTVKWNYTVPFVYTGAEKTVEVTGLPNGITALYLGNTAVNAGEYTASVTLSSTDSNYLQPDTIGNQQWYIRKAPGAVTDLLDQSKTYDGIPVSEPKYAKLGDGAAKISYTLNSIVDGATVRMPLEGLPVDAGSYTVTVHLDEGMNHLTAETSRDFTISKARYDMSNAAWDYTAAFIYDATAKTVRLTGLPDGVWVSAYTGHTATNAGGYTAHAVLSYEELNHVAPEIFPALQWTIRPRTVILIWDGYHSRSYDGLASNVQAVVGGLMRDDICIASIKGGDAVAAGTYTASVAGLSNPNYVLPSMGSGQSYTIEKALYDLSGTGWDYRGPFDWDGKIKTVLVKGLPAGLSVAEYSGNKAVNPASYTASAKLSYDAQNYEEPAIALLKWVINSPRMSACQITGIDISADSLNVLWSSVNGASGYELFRFSEDKNVRPELLFQGNQLSFTDHSVKHGEPISYTTRAFQTIAGRLYYGPFGDAWTKIMMGACSFERIDWNSNSVSLEIRPVAGAAGYEIWRNIGSTDSYALAYRGLQPGFKDTALVPGMVYQYKARAYAGSEPSLVYGPFGLEKTLVTLPKPLFSLEVLDHASVRLNLTMSLSSTDEAGFEVWRSSGFADGFERIHSSSLREHLTYTDTGLDTGKTYSYRLRLYTIVGSTIYYGPMSEVSIAGISAPMLTAEPLLDGSINLSWTSVPQVNRYELWRSDEQKEDVQLLYDGDGNGFVDTGLKDRAIYTYRVRGYREALLFDHNVSVFSLDTALLRFYTSYSNNVTCASLAASAPSALTLAVPELTAASRSESEIQIEWPAVTGAAGYEVWASTRSIDGFSLLFSGTARSFTDAGLQQGVVRYYKARAYLSDGTDLTFGPYGSTKSAMPLFKPVLNLEMENDRIAMTWSGINPSLGFEVWRSEGSSPGFVLWQTTNPAWYVAPIQDSAVSGREYRYQVRAFKAVGSSVYYGPFSEVGRLTALGIPLLKSESSTDGKSIQLSWNTVTGAVGFELWRSTGDSNNFTLVYKGENLHYSDAIPLRTVYHYKVRAYAHKGLEVIYSPDSAVRSMLPAARPQLFIGSVDNQSISLSWTGFGSWVTTDQVLYRLLRSTGKEGQYSVIHSTVQNSFTDTGLTQGTVYHYKVQGIIEIRDRNLITWDGDTRYVYQSDAKSVTATDLHVNRFDAVALGDTSVKLSWNAVPGASGYTLYRMMDKENEWIGVSGAQTEYIDEGLVPNAFYEYQLLASMEAGGRKISGPWSRITPVVTLPKFAPAAQVLNGSNIKLTWPALPGVIKYEVWSGNGSNPADYYIYYSGKAEEFTYIYGKPGEVRSFKVHAYLHNNYLSQEVWSGVTSVEIPVKPFLIWPWPRFPVWMVFQ